MGLDTVTIWRILKEQLNWSYLFAGKSKDQRLFQAADSA